MFYYTLGYHQGMGYIFHHEGPPGVSPCTSGKEPVHFLDQMRFLWYRPQGVMKAVRCQCSSVTNPWS